MPGSSTSDVERTVYLTWSHTPDGRHCQVYEQPAGAEVYQLLLRFNNHLALLWQPRRLPATTLTTTTLSWQHQPVRACHQAPRPKMDWLALFEINFRRMEILRQVAECQLYRRGVQLAAGFHRHPLHRQLTRPLATSRLGGRTESRSHRQKLYVYRTENVTKDEFEHRSSSYGQNNHVMVKYMSSLLHRSCLTSWTFWPGSFDLESTSTSGGPQQHWQPEQRVRGRGPDADGGGRRLGRERWAPTPTGSTASRLVRNLKKTHGVRGQVATPQGFWNIQVPVSSTLRMAVTVSCTWTPTLMSSLTKKSSLTSIVHSTYGESLTEKVFFFVDNRNVIGKDIPFQLIHQKVSALPVTRASCWLTTLTTSARSGRPRGRSRTMNKTISQSTRAGWSGQHLRPFKICQRHQEPPADHVSLRYHCDRRMAGNLSSTPDPNINPT